MQRCPTTTPHTTRLRRTTRAAATALALCLSAAAVPAIAQTATFAPVQGQTRAFPPQALRGTLIVTTATTATIDGNALNLAPAFKLYNPQNTQVRPGTVVGQSYTVNYVIEKSTGLVHAAWVLNSAEAAQKRARADNGFWASLFR
mgnify:FL=1